MIGPKPAARRGAQAARPSAARIPVLLLAVAVLLAGCAVKLAPDYEQSIVIGLSQFDARIRTHMLSVAEGTEPGLEPESRRAYEGLEGTGRALIALIELRPEPEPPGWLAAKLGGSTVADGPPKAPTAEQIEKILEQLANMKEEDRKQGLAPGQYKLYANAIESFMRNALTYEMALKR